MKKSLLVIALAIGFALMAASCGDTCVCTYYEDGKKVYSYKDTDVKYHEDDLCESQSQPKADGISIVDGGKVTTEYVCETR
ncbi:MAG TPA: hypothetical protein P5134_00355 [Bacteroidales bacterium]|nr:hypothetical protein [Bacteroidales bacterium]HOS57108.1 hypothetical protein [Bacteroidales bacterium]HRT13047.1 hypothetical protein [Bacteroidales bacterium]HXK73604.1 hypothetical protein [Bacteroidales bacterium]